MTVPNFLVIGAARSGTTALYNYLKQHPQIFMCPIKEAGFFAFEQDLLDSGAPDYELAKRLTRQAATMARITDLATYRALFERVSDEIAVGEVSPAYLSVPRACERIKYYIPDAKLIAILRDPTERAYSAYVDCVANWGWRLDEFARVPQALRQEPGWLSNPRRYWYVWVGFYSIHLARYFEHFARSQVQVYLYDDFKARPAELIQDMYRFLVVNSEFTPAMSLRHAITGIPKNKTLHWVLRNLTLPRPITVRLKSFVPAALRQRINKLKNDNLIKPHLSPEVRQEWLQVYREDILQLQDLIGRDLSAWLEP